MSPSLRDFRERLPATLFRLAGVQQGRIEAPACPRFVNRNAGRVLADLAHRTGLTRHQPARRFRVMRG